MLHVIAPAKVNLFLGVGPLRADGYHALVSVFHALALADEITITPAEKLSLECDTDLGTAPEDNLAYRAALAFGEALGETPAVALKLAKRIPHGAGLGGGSSDAAAVIAGLAHLRGISRTDSRCLRVAALLGADVPFFLTSGAALMTGRGDEVVLEPPALAGVPAVVVRPPLPVSTADAYRAFDAAPVPAGQPDAVVAALQERDVAALAAAMRNNMERASAFVLPEVDDALSWLRGESGVRGAIVAGSGSAIFGLTESAQVADRIAEAATDRGWWSSATQLVNHGVQVRED